MTDNSPPPEFPELPRAAVVPKSTWSLQLVWLVPLVAIVIGGWLVVRSVMERGPQITISFSSSEGIEAGKTKITYKNVEIGQVTTVKLSPDLKHVIVIAQMVKDFAPHLVTDTRFWLVRPRISGGSVSGLSTVLSGAFIAVSVGKSDEKGREFTALETAPVIDIDTPGQTFVLHSPTAGSLSIGSPIFFRQLQAGQVVSFQLDEGGQGVTFKIFIMQEYLKYVSANTRFWNQSGIDVTADSNGIKIDVGSIVSILIGGIAFETPTVDESEPAMPDQAFVLFTDRTLALKNPEREVIQFVATFDQSVRGLSPGASVDFRGINIGEVVAVNLEQHANRLYIPVTLNIYPERLRSRSRTKQATLSPAERNAFIDRMVATGLRALLRTGNLLTGQLYVTLDFVPGVSKASINWSADPPEFPTKSSDFAAIETAIASIAKKIDDMPLQQIGNDAHQMLQNANKLLQHLDTEVTPEAHDMLVDARKALGNADRMLSSDSPLQQSATGALQEVGEAARALRILADYLERHPESLIRGKPEDTK
jgi:paraquat-inducible protein B